mmetsp:Transcript_36552/g.76070  ORF Transcript_36552/g.76070 Transcript_36552/m.76070 type:complete len:83 (-) Transcript_36552:548-796(-)
MSRDVQKDRIVWDDEDSDTFRKFIHQFHSPPEKEKRYTISQDKKPSTTDSISLTKKQRTEANHASRSNRATLLIAQLSQDSF